ncbi:hypothetical protein Tco_1303587 [Tanacetum coccineum]
MSERTGSEPRTGPEPRRTEPEPEPPVSVPVLEFEIFRFSVPTFLKNSVLGSIGSGSSSIGSRTMLIPKSVNLRNEEDNRRGVEYVMSKILGFYKECLELEPEYLTRVDDEGEVTLYLMRKSLEVLRKFHWMILGGRFNQLSHVSSPLLSKPREY